MILDGATGKLRKSIPAPLSTAEDSSLWSLPHKKHAFDRVNVDAIRIANFRGLPQPRDILIKDRYSRLWAFDDQLNLLWHFHEGITGHFPYTADVNGDGRDETFVGYHLVDANGRLLWTLPVVAFVWLAAFLLFPGFVRPMSPAMSAAEVAAFYRDPENLPRIRYSMILFNWFAVGLIPILALIVLQVRRMAHRTPIFSYSLLACAAGGPTIFLMANLFWLLAAFRPTRDPQLTMLFNDLAWVTFSTQVGFLIAQSLILALAIHLDRRERPVFPRWVAHFNLVVAALLAPAAFAGTTMTGPIAWDGLLTFWVRNVAIGVWIVVMGVVLARATLRERGEDAALAA